MDGSGDAQCVLLTDDRGTVIGIAGPTGAGVGRGAEPDRGALGAPIPAGGAIALDDAGFSIAHSRYVRFGWWGMLREPSTGLGHTHFRECASPTARPLALRRPRRLRRRPHPLRLLRRPPPR